MFARTSRHLYKSPLKAAILDWSGTTVDAYVLAPAIVFRDVFKKYGCPISMEEARKPMGLRKDLHIKAITEDDNVKERWKNIYGKHPDQNNVDKMFEDFVPMQLNCLRSYATLIPGVKKSVDILKQKYNLKIGTTTGFLKSMTEILLEESKKQGYEPDSCVAGDEVTTGFRPTPFMVYKNLDLLGVYPIQSVVKVDDTVSGIGEGLNAGCWTVGLSRYSNYMDIDSLEHAQSLTKEELEEKNKKSRKILINSGAHYVIDDLSDLPEVVKDINRRIKLSQGPNDYLHVN